MEISGEKLLMLPKKAIEILDKNKVEEKYNKEICAFLETILFLVQLRGIEDMKNLDEFYHFLMKTKYEEFKSLDKSEDKEEYIKFEYNFIIKDLDEVLNLYEENKNIKLTNKKIEFKQILNTIINNKIEKHDTNLIEENAIDVLPKEKLQAKICFNKQYLENLSSDFKRVSPYAVSVLNAITTWELASKDIKKEYGKIWISEKQILSLVKPYQRQLKADDKEKISQAMEELRYIWIKFNYKYLKKEDVQINITGGQLIEYETADTIFRGQTVKCYVVKQNLLLKYTKALMQYKGSGGMQILSVPINMYNIIDIKTGNSLRIDDKKQAILDYVIKFIKIDYKNDSKKVYIDEALAYAEIIEDSPHRNRYVDFILMIFENYKRNGYIKDYFPHKNSYTHAVEYIKYELPTKK